MSQENVQIVHRLMAALPTRDVATIVEASDPDIEWHSALAVISEAGAYRGPEGLRKWMIDVEEAFELFEVDLEGALDVGDLVLAVGHLTYRGKVSGVEQNDRFGWIFRFNEGKLVYLRAFRDPERVLAAVGLSE